MNSNVYSIQDAKAGIFFRPFIQPNDATAVRGFQDSLQADKNSQIYLHPSDFNLYCLGTFEDSTGKIVSEVPRLIVGAASLIVK